MVTNQSCPNPKCNAVIDWIVTHCPKCKIDVGVPNQRELKQAEEIEALSQRYDLAKEQALQGDLEQQSITEFEQQLSNDSKAIINLSAPLLANFLSDKNSLYANYNLQTQSEMRKVSDMKNDKQRRGAEAQLFGQYATEIRYAALSLDNKGLISYGCCSMTVADITMENSATVLQENSYDFVRRYRLVPGDDTPLGFRAIWTQRYRLAIAKLATKLSNNAEHNGALLLKSDGNRHNDQFMEVHIYGAFDKQCLDAVSVPSAQNIKDKSEHVHIAKIHDYATTLKISCTEYD